MDLSLADQLCYSTVRIECTTSIGRSTGTGFFFNFLDNKETHQKVPCIVTNKHVVENAIDGFFLVKPKFRCIC